MVNYGQVGGLSVKNPLHAIFATFSGEVTGKIKAQREMVPTLHRNQTSRPSGARPFMPGARTTSEKSP